MTDRQDFIQDFDQAVESGKEEKLKVLTFGCRLNAYESEVMRREADKAGLGDLDGGAILVNTCAVTAEAVRQARQAIRRAARENPDARIIVSGCAAQTEGEVFGSMDEVDLVIGNDDKLASKSYRALPDFGVNSSEKVRVNDIMSIRETASHMVDSIDGHSRAFVQVQNGCDHRCTFCIIPYGRGNSRSVPAGEVVDQIKKLVDRGYREVVLTGVDTTSWGADLPGNPTLGILTQAILKEVPDLARLRLSSIDSIEVDEPLMDAIASEKRFMPHLHLSLQHGDDMILKRMARRHLRDHSIEFCETVRKVRPEMIFGADIIAGFPTETDAMFENSMRIVEECGLTHLHIFPFSAREGTPAAKMPPVDGNVVKERARLLRALGAEKFRDHLQSCIGDDVEVLVEQGGRGKTERFTPVAIDGEFKPGEIISGKVTGHDGKMLAIAVGEQPASSNGSSDYRATGHAGAGQING